MYQVAKHLEDAMITAIYFGLVDMTARHLPLAGLAAGLVMVLVGATVIRNRKRATPEPAATQGAVLGSDGQLHAVWAGYDGEGVYAWSCLCGDARSDFQGQDYALEEGTQHLVDVGALVSA